MSSDEDFPLPNNSLNSHLQALSNADVSTHEIEDMNQGVEALLAPYQNKVYMSGFLQMQNLLLPDGLPYQANQWSKWYVELVGSILQFYPVSSPDDCEGAKLDLIKKQEPNPMFLADASVSILKASPDSGHPYVFDLNTQGANKFLLSCLTEDELSIWCLAIRLSNWEYTRIMEYFTALWFDLPQYKPFLDNDYSSQVSYPSAFIRKSGSDDWARLNYQPQQERTKVPAHPKRILLTPGSSKNASDNVQGYEIQSLDHIYLVYPEPEVDDQPSHLVTLIKLEGDITDLSTQRKLPFILIDADSIEVSTNIILSAIDLFGLYRRPNLIEYWFPQIPNPSELGLLLDDIVTLTITDKVDFETKRDFDAVLSYKYGLNQPRTPLHDVEQTFQLQIEAEQEKMRQEKLKEQKEIENQMTFGSRSRGRGSRGSIPFSTEDTPKEQARKTSVSFQEQPHFIPHSGNNSVISEELIQEPRSVSKPSNDDDDDSSEDDIPTLRKTRAARPNQRKPNTSRPQQLDSESDDDDDEGQNWAPIGRNKAANSSQDNVESLNKAMGNLSIPGVQANRSASAMGANQQLKPNQAPRPFTMFKSPSVEAVQKPSSSETSPNTSILPGGSTGMRVPRGPKSRANLPSPSDSEDDEDDTPLNQRISGAGYQQEQPQLQPYDPRFDHQVHRYPQMSEDDVPLGPGAGPYGNSAEQLNMAQGYPGGPQYGMYPQDPRLSGGMPGYDPYGVPLQPGMYPQQPQMPRSNRPMTLLEAQEMNHFNNQQMMGQAKFGPLIQLPEKKQHQPSGGLVGAINALQQQRAQTRYTNAHSRMQQSSSTTMLGQYADPQALAFEREKERVLQEQRMMALGGNASFMGGYSPYGPGGMMANGSAPQLAQGYPNPYGQQYSPMQHQLGSQDYFHPEGQYPPQFVGGFAPSGGYPQEDEDDDVAIGAIMQPAGANNILSPSSQGLGTSTLGSRSTVFQDPSSIKPTRINRNRPKSPVVNLDEYDSDEAPMQQVNTTARPYQSAYDPSPQGRDSEPEIEDDLMELFEDFSESKLQMRPYSYLRPADLYDVFRDWCDEESLDDDTIPNRRTFEYLMEQGGFVKKRRPAKMIQEQEERMGGKIKDAHEEWWYNIALVDD